MAFRATATIRTLRWQTDKPLSQHQLWKLISTIIIVDRTFPAGNSASTSVTKAAIISIITDCPSNRRTLACLPNLETLLEPFAAVDRGFLP